MKKILLVLFIYVSAAPCFLAIGEDENWMLYRPVFELKSGTAEAGTAFIIKFSGKDYAVSAQHLIGTAGGLSKDYSGSELETEFRQLTINPIYSGFRTISSDNHVSIPGAAALTGVNLTNDLFISPLNAELDSTPFLLADALPKQGERVLLVAKLVDSNEILHAATVLTSDENELIYLFDDESLNLRATSGAPIVNSEVEVVGVNLAGGREPGTGLVGFANPVSSIRNQLLRN